MNQWGVQGFWTADRIVTAFVRFYRTHQRWPSTSDLQDRTRRNLPDFSTLYRRLGSLAETVRLAQERLGDRR